jgi:hypothetical protein
MPQIMETDSPGEDLSESKVEVEDEPPPAVGTLTIQVLAYLRLICHGMFLRVFLRTLESKSSRLARLCLLCYGLLIHVLLHTSKSRSESGTELL